MIWFSEKKKKNEQKDTISSLYKEYNKPVVTKILK